VKVSARRHKGYAHSLTARHHTLVADEPQEQGGADSGPMPQELLALSLASCTAVTVEMYADRKGWDLGDLEVEVDGELAGKSGPSKFDVLLRLPKALDAEQQRRLLIVAAKCPVHRALAHEAEFHDHAERV
jgi:putative redox protein